MWLGEAGNPSLLCLPAGLRSLAVYGPGPAVGSRTKAAPILNPVPVSPQRRRTGGEGGIVFPRKDRSEGSEAMWPLANILDSFVCTCPDRLLQGHRDTDQGVAGHGKHYGNVALAEVKAELSQDSGAWALLV